MAAYEALARWYDSLTGDVNYEAWADYLERHLEKSRRGVRTVLDLACGTGTLSRILAQRGYEVVAVDASSEMLAVAAEKVRDVSGEAPLLLCQRMEQLDLYDTVDACVCALDSINYVTDARTLRRAFGRVFLFLNPGGRFVFDVNTPARLRAMDGQVYLDEREEVYCVWRGDFSARVPAHGGDELARLGQDINALAAALERNEQAR
ncbi:MAG: methyltransferase domain-containing protein, partial [Clostridia bacterium]|nr:methyltransferase domain-containing protein [Clostridia bacterium]